MIWQRCTPRSRLWLTLLSQSLTLVFLIFLSLEGLWILPAQMKVMVVTMGGFPLGVFYTAIPLGVLEDLVQFSDSLVGHLPGGLAHVTIVGSMFFASVCGVALAASAAVGALMIPLMIKQGFGRRFSAAVTASASVVGPIIPPSVGMIIYSNATGGKVSIGGSFLRVLFRGCCWDWA